MVTVTRMRVPCPLRLSTTATSPPSSPANRLLITRPSPVPPNLRDIDVSAWVNGTEEAANLLPGHTHAGVHDTSNQMAGW